ncbi:glycoside hydrolase 105 family protein [Anaerocolumna cellulosilytica]|uniref:Glycoside hydrolase 105 family protein n=1 Tax=Anaerocolumna cellulosilytica TaxID=433286 RepID=A0A6S6R3M5_9FIRM|nr:glycoside hydrolase family 88 protein [Anaerocolumna cellulosilytica]MBB5196049.1 unsaturated rhamnogalacturonyl hydrolase [Anaerocolumna cellulosilytica]BCJ93648.1 glycoside hydrolase 105 family protein [Anaerocolumna cellulosilytica]
MNTEKLNRYIKEYLMDYKRYREKEWCYEDGCVYIGAKAMYEATKDEFYINFLIKNIDTFIAEDGEIQGYDLMTYNLDNMNAGKILFFLYDHTGKEKYRKAIETMMNQLKVQPRTECGNFWHKKIYPNQIWLDGLYMAQPFYMEYETRYNKQENYADIVKQFKNVRYLLYNESKQLYYHAYDETRTRIWANPANGCSPNFWLRSMGWYLMALIDTYDKASEQIYEHYRVFKDLLKEALQGILKYQDSSTKLFYQLIDLPEQEGNYLETSGSIMIGYALLKGSRLEALLSEKYRYRGEEILDSLIENRIVERDGKLHLTQICAVAGLGPDKERDGSIAYYLSEPINEDDQKAAGPLMMLYSEYLKLNQ